MSKAVLIAIRPEWCEKIASGEKTIEVRKTRPKLPMPFKCYIYCTRGSPYLNRHNGRLYLETKDILGGNGNGLYERLSGRVIGEFVCDCVLIGCEMGNADRAINEGCIREKDLLAYSAGNPLYGWHISELKIYDEPKKLEEFYTSGTLSNEDFLSTLYDGNGDPTRRSYASYLFTRQLRRPPQSWCYVEELI